MRVQLFQRITVLGIGAAVLVAFALSQFIGATPEAGVPTIVPLATLEPEAVQTVNAAPRVGTGADERVPGVVIIGVDATFKTGVLTEVDPDVRLISDRSTGDQIIGGVYYPLVVRVVAVYVPDDRLDAFIAGVRKLPGVLNAGPNGVGHLSTNDPLWNQQQALGLRNVDLADYWAFFGRGSPNVRVAVVDTGVGNISELSGRLDAGHNSTGIGAIDDTTDNNGHGTAVASIIGSACDNGVEICGIAPNVHIVPVKACAPAPFVVDCPELAVLDALQWLWLEDTQGRGVRVINMSFGRDSYNTNIQAVLQDLHDDRRIMMFASTGNDSTGQITDPARSPYVTAVGGVNIDLTRNSVSNWGPEIDVSAPYSNWAVLYGSIGQPDGGWYIFDGTSSATAVMSGLGALYVSGVFAPRWVNGTYVNNLFDVDAFMARESWWNDQVGNGIPNNYIQYFSYWRACNVWDFNGDHDVDVTDEQLIAYRYGAFFGHPLYNKRYDVEPGYWEHDLDIDIRDLQRVFGRDGMSCP